MPMKYARPCVEPGCPRLVYAQGVSRCPEHQEKYLKELDKRRPSASKRGYDSEWARVRDEFLRRNPKCVVCGAKATIAHHVIRKRAGGPDESANLIPLCATCHGKLHAQTGESFNRSEKNAYRIR
jgi:5-methylcytosine-specific restriction protein A